MVLEESERLGFADVISWQGDNVFRVHNQKEFEQRIMTTYFKQTQYRSFQRQLNIYGFKRLKAGIDTGSYIHPFFVRGKADMCCFMRRTKIKKKGLRSEKTTSKSTKDFSFANFNAESRTMPTNRTSSGNDQLSNSCPDSSSALSNMGTKFTVARDTIEPFMTYSPIPLRKILSLDQSSLSVFPYDGKNKIDVPVVDSGIRNNLSTISTETLTYGNTHLADSDGSRQGNMSLPIKQEEPEQRQLQNQSMLQLQIFQQQQMLIERLQAQIKSEALSETNRNRSRTSSSQLHSGSSNTGVHLTNDMDLDLDTLFDDNFE